MVKVTDEINANLCPICQNINQCMLGQPEPCWCYSAQIPSTIFEKIPPELQHKSCICKKCIAQFNVELAIRAK
ncbi:cysteine-rich CWC family protein [Thalassotalea piscium]|uniref:Cysteine-rich CWC family protein n=1 Tax=Thalassotalea piscium TaxID=1230533 RepID=A0A7X0TSG4_9GAMM|nr:cysteine-rich CWC family protein [Thalassotalea piscium]MBB6542102.1 hypothetical protein [Thalassotalea piscium]